MGYGRNMTVPAHDGVPYDTDIAQAAALMADPTRAAMLRALLSDRPLAAGELARLAGVSAATMTGWLLAERIGIRSNSEQQSLNHVTQDRA